MCILPEYPDVYHAVMINSYALYIASGSHSITWQSLRRCSFYGVTKSVPIKRAINTAMCRDLLPILVHVEVARPAAQSIRRIDASTDSEGIAIGRCAFLFTLHERDVLLPGAVRRRKRHP